MKRRGGAGNPASVAVGRLAGLGRGRGHRTGLRGSQGAAWEQPVLAFEPPPDPPAVPKPRRPALAIPALPNVPKRAGPRRDALDALCRCPSCAKDFADYRSYRRHRRGGHCLDPAAVGLTLLDEPCPCWGQPEETR